LLGIKEEIDFTMPANFVKLLKIEKYPDILIAEDMNYIWTHHNFEEKLIYFLIQDLKQCNYLKCYESIKQQAQQIKWSIK